MEYKKEKKSSQMQRIDWQFPREGGWGVGKIGEEGQKVQPFSY